MFQCLLGMSQVSYLLKEDSVMASKDSSYSNLSDVCIVKRVTTDPWVHKVHWNSGYQVTPRSYSFEKGSILSGLWPYTPKFGVSSGLFSTFANTSLLLTSSQPTKSTPSSPKQACYQETTLDKWFFAVWEIPREVACRSSHKNYFYVFQSPQDADSQESQVAKRQLFVSP